MPVSDIFATIKTLLAPLQRRVGLMILRGTLGSIDDSQSIQMVQLSHLADQERDTVERFQHFGFTSVPSQNAEVILVSIGGDSDHPVAIVVDDRRYRPTGLSEGEAAVYTKQNGLRVYCKADGTVFLGDSSGNDFVALSQKVLTELNAIKSVLATGLVLAANANLTSGVVTGTVVGSYSPNSVAASQVKAK